MSSFTEKIVELAWKRSDGRCECTRTGCGHGKRCNKMLVWSNRGKDTERGSWEAHHIVSVKSNGSDALSNCQILCTDCHKRTRTYGRH